MEVCDFVLIVFRKVGVEKVDCNIDLGLNIFVLVVLEILGWKEMENIVERIFKVGLYLYMRFTKRS